MASLHMKHYEVAIWRDRITAQSLPDKMVKVRALTPNGAVSAVLSRLRVSAAVAVLVADLDYDTGDWLFHVHFEQGNLTWVS